MKITLTDKGLQALAQNQTVQLLDFIASDSRSLSVMERYVAGQSVGSNTFYQYGIEENHTYIKGDTYTPSDGGKPYKVENTFLEVRGTLNCLDVPSSFMMRSMGIKAKIGENPPFVYAFGSISSSDKPYPVNSGELISYITPVKIIYDNAPDVTTEESGVPWKNFIQHTDLSVNSEDGVHGLKINPNTKELTVGDTTIILSGGDERIAELEEEVKGILKYDQQDDREYNSEWVLRRTGTGTSGDPYKLYTPRDLDSVRENPNAYYELVNNLDLYPCIGIKARVSGTTYEITEENPDAPCYNKGMGWACLYLNGGHFDGNHKYIKNLFIGACIDNEVGVTGGIFNPVPYNMGRGDYIGRRSGLFCRIHNGTLSNLNLIESVILLGNTDNWGNMRVSSFCNGLFDNSSISECSSSVDILCLNTNGSGQIYGGIVSDKQGDCPVKYCAFHGTINNQGIPDSSYLGGIAGTGGGWSEEFVGCYCDAQILPFARDRSGFSFDWVYGIRSSYFSGYVYPRGNDINGMGTFLRQNDGTNKIELAQTLKTCYSLEGSSVPDRIQGTIVSNEYMRSREFVNDLNSGLPEPKFVFNPNGFPKLYFEEDTIPYSSPVATINTDTNYVLDSGYTVQTLAQMATVQDVAQVTRSLSQFIDRKSTVNVAEVQILVSDWSDTFYRYYTPYVEYTGQSTDNIIIIPPDLGFFAYNIYVNGVGYDTGGSHPYETYIDFRCDTKPSVDISFKCIIIKGGIVS